MKLIWLVSLTATIFIEENLCVPAISPLRQSRVLYPEENWDNCFLDAASTQPGLCKTLNDCPEIFKKWDTERVYTKTCYYIKRQPFVCCPTSASNQVLTTTEKFEYISPIVSTAFPTQKPANIFSEIFSTEPGILTTKPENKVTQTTIKIPSNIFLQNVNSKTTPTTTKRPSNIFLDRVDASKTTSKKPPSKINEIITTQKPEFMKRRSEKECDLHNSQEFELFNVNAALFQRDKFPFMAVLGLKPDADNKVWYPCGGILISAKFVLTAAHCADFGGEIPALVRLGGANLTDSPEGTIQIKQFIAHPDYNGRDNDIALVELDQEVDNTVACLWAQHDLPIAEFVALGYGHIGFDSINSNQLFKATLIPIEKSQCQEYYKLDGNLLNMDILDSHLCAGDTRSAQKDCQGDTGGPLITELGNVNYVVGITSFGLGCADLPPSIFTRVSSFLDWIESIIWPKIDVRIDK